MQQDPESGEPEARSNRDDHPRSSAPDPGIFDRVGAAWEAGRDLLSTRGQIFRAEVSEQAALVGRGAAALAIALVIGLLMVLVLTALIASLFALLFGSAWAGLLATFVLYLAATAVAVTFGVKALSKVELDFPATRRGLSGDISAVQAAISPVQSEGDEADVEERFRTGGL